MDRDTVHLHGTKDVTQMTMTLHRPTFGDTEYGLGEFLAARAEAEKRAAQDAEDAAAGVVVDQVGRGAAHMPVCVACGSAMRQRRIKGSDTAVTVQFFCDCDPDSEVCRSRARQRAEERIRSQAEQDKRERSRLKRSGIVPGPDDWHRRSWVDAFGTKAAANARSALAAHSARQVFEDPCEPREVWPACGSCGSPHRPDTVPAVAQPPICEACGEAMDMGDAEAVHVRKINVEFACGCATCD